MTEPSHDLATDRDDSARVIAFDRTELEQSIVARFEKVAARRAAHTAICGEGERWTYAELDRRTNQIARAILDRTSPGAGCIAYLVDYSPSMVVCALGTLKAAKAYLCLHPDLPPAAMRDIFNDAASDLLLTDESHEEMARGLVGDERSILRLGDIEGHVTAAPLGLTISAKDAAAIFYTSGSTGRPKGVVKSHGTMLHRAWLCAQYDSINTTDRQSLLTHCGFASSEADMFGALLNGAALELFNFGTGGFAGLATWIDERRITLLHPPVLLFRRYLSMMEGVGRHPSVRLVALAGETVIASDIQQWRERFALSCALRHRFSSTEAGHIAVGCIANGEIPMPATVPAVRPVEDKYISVVDDQGNPVEQGETGELVVRSAFLGDGYWRRQQESAEHFTVAPNHPGQHVFRTGDMVRFWEDGGLEFLGRRDNQVKVRGYRVEIHEIEDALRTLAGVKDAAVIAEARLQQVSLIAFVVMKDGAPFRSSALRAELRSIVPQWKIPALFYPIESLPLTPTGKIDRHLLRDTWRDKVNS